MHKYVVFVITQLLIRFKLCKQICPAPYYFSMTNFMEVFTQRYKMLTEHFILNELLLQKNSLNL